MPPLQNSQDNDCDMHWLQYLKGQAEAQSNTGGHVRLVEVSGQRPLCGISQLHVRHLKWHADLPKALGTDGKSSEPDFNLFTDECDAFSVSA